MDSCSSWRKSLGGTGGKPELKSRWQLHATCITRMKQGKHVFHLSVWLFGVYVSMGIAPSKWGFKKRGKRERKVKPKANVGEKPLPQPREKSKADMTIPCKKIRKGAFSKRHFKISKQWEITSSADDTDLLPGFSLHLAQVLNTVSHASESNHETNSSESSHFAFFLSFTRTLKF